MQSDQLSKTTIFNLNDIKQGKVAFLLFHTFLTTDTKKKRHEVTHKGGKQLFLSSTLG